MIKLIQFSNFQIFFQTVKSVYKTTSSSSVATPNIQVVPSRVEVTETRSDEGALVNDVIGKLTPIIQKTITTSISQKSQVDKRI